MYRGKTIKLIIPALNETEAIGSVIDDVPDWVDEIIVADNGSTDDTPVVAQRYGATVVRQPRRGYGSACLAGIDTAGHCDVLVFMDGDYSDHGEQMDRLVGPIIDGDVDMVVGSRTRGAGAGVLTPQQRFGNRLACGLIRLLWGQGFSDLGPFRAVDAAALRRLDMCDPNFGWIVEMQIKAVRAGMMVVEVPVDYRPRIGISKISGTVRGVVGAGTKILATIARYVVAPPPTHTGRDRLILFSKFPRPGRCKTRLIGTIGALPAARLQQLMTEKVFAAASRLDNIDLRVHYTGCGEREMRRWLGPGDYVRQGRGDLGERMKRALCNAFEQGCRRAVIVGSDCPSITSQDMERAFELLDDNDLVLGPSTDGGYYLIGMSRPADVFAGIRWSTPQVLERTLESAYRQGLRVAMLPNRTDIDMPKELATAPQLTHRAGRPFVSVVVPALNEADNIRRTIESLRCAGVEIIVADGGSTDATAEIAQECGARVIQSRPGRARQMNSGAAAAAGEVLLFVHADTILPDDYAAMIFIAMLDKATTGGAFRHVTDMESSLMKFSEAVVDFRSRHLRLPYGDQAIFVRRTAFEQTGGYPLVDPAEDLEFIRRLNRLGQIEILPAAAVTSARRWRKLGTLKTMLLNQLILAGCFLDANRAVLRRLRHYSS